MTRMLDVDGDSVYAEERQARIEHRLTGDGRVAVMALAGEFAVTTETIRRDLSQLESLGKVRRVHGGAVLPTRSSRVEETLDKRRDVNSRAKERIARAAMTLLPRTFSGAIAIDAGTTTGRLAAHVARWTPAATTQSLIVVTNSLSIAVPVAGNPALEVHLLGGRLRGITGAAVGASTIDQIGRMRPVIAFIGANGVHARFGLSTPDDDESAVKGALARCARRAVALVDASKLGEETLNRFAELSDLDTLITDVAPAADLASALDRAEVEVIVA